MAEQVILEFVGDPTGLKPLADAMGALGQLTDDQAASLRKATADFNTRKQAIVAGEKAAQDAIKATTSNLSKEAQQFEKIGKGLNDIGKAIAGGNLKQATDSFKKLGDQITTTVTKATTMKQQLVALKKELQGLDEGSEKFKKLSVEAARLEDKIGDVNQQIRTLASDTFAIDAVVDGVRGMTAAFSVAQATSALLGDENEDLQKTLVKLNALMLISTSLQEVANQLTGQGAAKTAILSGAQKVYAFVTEGATVATRFFNAALAATGFGAVIVGLGLLIANWDKLTAAIFGTTDALEKFNKLGEENEKIVESIDADTDIAIRKLKLRGATEEEIMKRRIYGNELALDFIDDEIAAQERLTIADFKNVEEFQKAEQRRTALVNMREDRLLQNEEFVKAHNQKLLQEYNDELEAEAQDNEEAHLAALERQRKHFEELKAGREALQAAQKLGIEDQMAGLELQMLDADNIDKLAIISKFYDKKRELLLLDTQLTANQLKLQTRILDDEEKAKKQIIIDSLKFKMAVGKLDEEDYIEHERKKTEATQKANQIRQAMIEAVQIVVNTLFTIAAQQRQAETDAQLKALDEQMATELENEELTSLQVSAIREKYRRQEAAIKTEAAKKDKEAAIAQAIINTALAVLKALGSAAPPANFIAAALAGVAGAAQVAVIASTPLPTFYEGTEFLERGNNPRGRDTIPVMAHEGERIVPSYINKHLEGIPNSMLPKLAMFADMIPHIGSELLMDVAASGGMEFDYKEMAKEVGAAIAKNPHTSIYIDKTGLNILLTKGNRKTHYLNNRYFN